MQQINNKTEYKNNWIIGLYINDNNKVENIIIDNNKHHIRIKYNVYNENIKIEITQVNINDNIKTIIIEYPEKSFLFVNGKKINFSEREEIFSAVLELMEFNLCQK